MNRVVAADFGQSSRIVVFINFLLGKSSGRKSQFVLNKKPKKVALHRRTLYYKIPVNFVTASDTGSTFVLPRHMATREESPSRRSQPSVPESPLFDTDSLKYSEFGVEHSKAKSGEFGEEASDDNSDVQAEYIRDQLDHSTETVSPEKLSLLSKSGDEADEPSFENVKMVKPERKCIEDECELLPCNFLFL